MKYYIIIPLLTFVTIFSLKAQNRVGVGTTDPQGTLHIDANKNTSGTSNATDDVIVSGTSGNVGLGKLSPAAKLNVNGNTLISGTDSVTNTVSTRANYITRYLKYGETLSTPPKAMLDIESPVISKGLRIANGTQNGGTNFVPILTTDAGGNVKWENMPSVTTITKGTIRTEYQVLTATSASTASSTYYDITSGNITIPSQGLWLIYAKVIIGTYRDSDTQTRGAGKRDVFMYLRTTGNTDISSTMVYPETTGLHIGVLQLTHLYDANTLGGTTLKLSLKSDHFYSSSTTPSYTNDAGWYRFKTYGSSTDFPWNDPDWTDPVFFAIRIDHQN